MAEATDRAIEVLEGGIETTVQDYPGRAGMLSHGLFPAGPMDHLAFRAANLLAGNPLGTAALEVTLGGLAVRFAGEATVPSCGSGSLPVPGSASTSPSRAASTCRPSSAPAPPTPWEPWGGMRDVRSSPATGSRSARRAGGRRTRR